MSVGRRVGMFLAGNWQLQSQSFDFKENACAV